MTVPQFRGAMCQGVLAAMEASPRLRPVLASVEPRYLDLIRRTSKLGWLPFEALSCVNEAHLAAAGDAAYRDFWRRYAVGSIHNSLFSALFEGALRIFGRHPGGLLRWLGRSWDVGSRGLGTMIVQLGENEGTVRVVDVAPVARRLTTTLSTEGSVAAVFELTGHLGEIECETQSLRDGSYAVHARWMDASAEARGPADRAAPPRSP